MFIKSFRAGGLLREKSCVMHVSRSIGLLSSYAALNSPLIRPLLMLMAIGTLSYWLRLISSSRSFMQ